MTGTVQGAVQGGVTGGLFNWVGGATDLLGPNGQFGEIAAHAAVGCVSSMVGGGKCGSGAAAAGFAEFAGPRVYTNDFAYNVAASSVLGGVGSVLGGGKFENGAITGAFGYMFNDWVHRTAVVSSGRSLTPGEVDAALAEFPTLDTDRIRIVYDLSGDAAYTPNDTMHFPTSESSCQDFTTCNNGTYVGWYEHEVTHVSQYQSGESPILGHIFSSAIFQFGNYLPLSTYMQTPSSQGLNTEQQADWHKWHYLCTHGLQAGC